MELCIAQCENSAGRDTPRIGITAVMVAWTLSGTTATDRDIGPYISCPKYSFFLPSFPVL